MHLLHLGPDLHNFDELGEASVFLECRSLQLDLFYFLPAFSGMTIGFSWKKIMQVDEEHLKDVLVDLRENYTNVGCLKLFLYCHYFLNDTYRIYSN